MLVIDGKKPPGIQNSTGLTNVRSTRGISCGDKLERPVLFSNCFRQKGLAKMAMSGTSGNGTTNKAQQVSRRAREELIVKQLLAWPSAGGETRKVASRGAERGSRSGEQLDEIIYLLRSLLLLLAPGDIVDEPDRESAPPHLDPNGMQQRYGLTPRENEVLAEMALGKSNRQIALALSVSVETIRSHVSHILSKMGAESRTEAAVKAVHDSGALHEGHRPEKARDVSCPVIS